MISVTVAAQGKPKRLFGGNFRAYGSGRLSICELEKDPNALKSNEKGFNTTTVKICRFVNKLIEFISTLIHYCLPYFFTQKQTWYCQTARKEPVILEPGTQKFDSPILFEIFKNLEVDDLSNCKLVCWKWNTTIGENSADLARTKTDQIRILFDEGEVVIYPIDEKKCPIRHPLPPLQVLRNRLRHLTTQSLFVRGLIPVESGPVLRLLLSLTLRPQQMYFIWSKFSPDSVSLFEDLVKQNAETVTDFGLEECSPSHLLTDRLLSPISSHLTSLRLWNNGKGSHYGVTDDTLMRINNSILKGNSIYCEKLGTKLNK
uniref:F-box domain-containing protein n=1 Tax=Caenorhabditis tropicalis TaxID=1561998 RepID=A0A1I7SZT6_9PELO